MINSEKLTDDKAELKQKGWKLFAAVIVIQAVLLSASYVLNSF